MTIIDTRPDLGIIQHLDFNPDTCVLCGATAKWEWVFNCCGHVARLCRRHHREECRRWPKKPPQVDMVYCLFCKAVMRTPCQLADFFTITRVRS